MKNTLLACLAFLSLGLAQASEPIRIEFKSGEPFTAAFKALPGAPDKPLLQPTGGRPSIEAGALLLANARFTIGALPGAEGRVEGSTGDTRPVGVLDLSKPWRIVLQVTAVESVAAGKDSLYIYVNNSSSRGADSPLGTKSQIARIGVKDLQIGENVFTAKAGDATSFIQVRAESGALVRIASIRIEAQ